MTLKNRVKKILEKLDELYPTQDKCFLDYETPHQLLIATILSAQCTDARVNLTTPDLFRRYPTPEDFAAADISEMESYVKSTGFYHHKAKNIIASMEKLVTEFGGEMPSDIDILTTFPGVGRKTANVIRCHIFGIPSVVVDTHVKRLSNRLGLTKNDDPTKIEFDLMKILPKSHWTRFNTQLITHGRAICVGKPKCAICMLNESCLYFEKSK